MKKLKLSVVMAIAVIATFGLSVSLQSLLAVWAPPGGDPPGDNVMPPVYNFSDTPVTEARIDMPVGVFSLMSIGNIITTGNVGIGTANPAAKLEVNGSFKISKSGTRYSIVNCNATPGNTLTPRCSCDVNQIQQDCTNSFLGTDVGAICYDWDSGTDPDCVFSRIGDETVNILELNDNSGTPGAGKVLTSDANGVGSWQTSSSVPTGAVMAFNLAACPSGWTELTNARGRTIVGKNTADASFDVLQEMGGAKTHTLSTAEMPSHNHTTNALSVAVGSCTAWYGAWTAAGCPAGTISYSGGNGPHNNLQPYLVLLYCQKN